VRILIVDDEAPARRRLRRLLPNDEVYEAASGQDGISLIDRLKPELVLLDIQMPDITGFEVLERIRHRPAVIFVTAFDEHAIAAFEAQAFDYLLKPVLPARLARAIERVGRITRSWPRQLEAEGRLIQTSGLAWVEAARNYVVLHSAETHVLRSSLDALAAKLDPERFVRVSRSHLVNMDFVKEMIPLPHGERRIVMRDGTEITWTRRYRSSRETA
jgi:two-component system LytT family response regulator